MSNVERAQLLVSQQRYDMAEEVLGQALANDPDDAMAHLLMAVCYRQTDRYPEATRSAEQAVHLEPNNSRCHAILGSVFLMRNRYEEAEKALIEAMRLNPYDVVNHGLLANVCFQREQWQKSLKYSESGLAVDPDDATCQNFRALSLERLGKGKVAISASRESLSRNPDDASTHATHGWALLNDGRYKEAQEAFRESLRLEPNNAFAKQGMIKALNANNFVFRIVLRWYTFMGRLSPNARWGIIIGLFVGQRILRQLAQRNPAWQPWIMPIVLAYVLFAVMTWVADPLFNTFLRFNRYGRYLLDRTELAASNISCGLFAIGLAFGIALAIRFQSATGLLLGIGFGILMLLPVSATFRCEQGYPFNIMATVTAVLGLLGMTCLALLVMDIMIPEGMLLTFIVGNVASQFLANYLGSVKVKR